MRARRLRRTQSAALLLALGATSNAQVSLYHQLGSAFTTLKQQGTIPALEQLPPTTPSGFPGLPPKSGELPLAQGDTEDRVLNIVSGGTSVTRNGPYVHMEGGSEFLYRGYRVVADTVDGNLRTSIFDMRGHVSVVGKDTVVHGERVVVDFNARSYQSYDAESQINPSLLKGKFVNPVYVKARESTGTQSEQHAQDSRFTTCDLPDPHFDIDAQDVDLRPGRRVIFRHAKIRILGRTIVTLPFLSIPLEERTYNYLPEVGQSDEEGYYIKNRYGIPLKGDGNNFDARLDYMTKLGTGYGGDYYYQAKRLSGVTRFYAVTGQSNTLEISNQHRQRFRWGDLAIDNDYQRNNYLYSSNTTTLSTRAVLSVPQGSGTTRLTFQRTGSTSVYSDSDSRQVSIDDSRKFGQDYSTALNLNWNTNSSTYNTGSTTSSSDTNSLDVRFHGQKEMSWATAAVDYQRSIPIGQTQQLFGGSDRTPVLDLQSDARRLFGGRYAQSFPFKAEFSLGEFYDSGSASRFGRGMFDFEFQRPAATEKRFSVDTNGQFRQTMYSDDTAQYILGLNTAAAYRLGRATSANLRYSYLRPYGYTPMLSDFTGETNQVTADVSYRVMRPWLVGAQTGYDILRLKTSDVAWQQLGVRSEYTPRKNLLFRTQASYDTYNQAWSNVRLDATWNPGATTVSLGTRYDGLSSTWANINLLLNNVRWGRLNFSVLLNYNGYSKQFDSQQYSFIYDLHCAEAVLTVSEAQTGYRPGRDVQFFVRLKAFPFDSLFGRGNRGQPVGTGTGSDF